jgi:putative membrane protein
MKIKSHYISRFAVVTATIGALALGSTAVAQPKEDDKPLGQGSIAGVGQKARKSKQNEASTSASPSPAGAMAESGPMKPGAGSAAGQFNAQDTMFLNKAAKDGMREVHMGQMAVQQGQSAEVKKLGSMIVADHTKANNQLMEIASKRGIKPDTRHKMDKMSKRDMENFDQAWLGMMVNDHQQDIAAYQRQAQNGNDPELRNFAKKTLPVLQKHLKAVEAAQKKMGSTMTSPPKTQGGTSGTSGGGTSR